MLKNDALLKERNPELIEEWDFAKNKNINLDTLKANSQKKVWWICRINLKHKWDSRVRSRAIEGHGCLYCLGRKVLKEESFAAKHPNMLKQWDWDSNGDIDPWALSPNSGKKVFWLCLENHEHKWKSAIGDRVRHSSGCPYCNRSNKTDKIKGDKSLTKNFPRIAREWHPTKNVSLKIEDITYGSSELVWWQCSKDKNHIWQTTVKNRTREVGGKCPFCSGVYVTEKNSLESLYPDVAKEWHPQKNGKLTPDKIKKASGKKVWWQCSKDPSHEWEAVVRNRTILGSGCPFCDVENKYIRLMLHQFDVPKSGSDYYKVFYLNLQNIKKMLKKSGFKKTKLEQPFSRMLYVAAITALETYLSDAFYQSVINSNERLNKLFTTDPEYCTKKYSIHDAIAWADKHKENATKHIQEIVWHNIPRVSHLYQNVLSVKIPLDNKLILKAISIRHDIVHRNGKTTKGQSIRINENDIEILINNISDFVSLIDEQLSKIEFEND